MICEKRVLWIENTHNKCEKGVYLVLLCFVLLWNTQFRQTLRRVLAASFDTEAGTCSDDTCHLVSEGTIQLAGGQGRDRTFLEWTCREITGERIHNLALSRPITSPSSVTSMHSWQCDMTNTSSIITKLTIWIKQRFCPIFGRLTIECGRYYKQQPLLKIVGHVVDMMLDYPVSRRRTSYWTFWFVNHHVLVYTTG